MNMHLNRKTLAASSVAAVALIIGQGASAQTIAQPGFATPSFAPIGAASAIQPAVQPGVVSTAVPGVAPGIAAPGIAPGVPSYAPVSIPQVPGPAGFGTPPAIGAFGNTPSIGVNNYSGPVYRVGEDGTYRLASGGTITAPVTVQTPSSSSVETISEPDVPELPVIAPPPPPPPLPETTNQAGRNPDGQTNGHVSIKGGYSSATDYSWGGNLGSVNTSLDDSYVVLATIGAKEEYLGLWPGKSFEWEFGYREYDVDRHNNIAGSSGDLDIIGGALNLHQDFGNWGGPIATLKPFVAVGFGFAHLTHNNHTAAGLPATITEDQAIAPFGQVFGGIKFNIAENTVMSLEARHWHAWDVTRTDSNGNRFDDKLSATEGIIGLTQHF